MTDELPKRCLSCLYILDGLTEQRCPECGRSFDPHNPKTYARRLQSGRLYLTAAICGSVAITAPLLAAYLQDLGAFIFTSHFIVTALLIPLMPLGLMVETGVLIVSSRILHRREPIRHRKAMLAARFISLVVLFFFGAMLFQTVLDR